MQPTWWHIAWIGESDFGNKNGVCTDIIDIHPFDWKAKRDEESEGHYFTTLISWKELSEEDVVVARRLGLIK